MAQKFIHKNTAVYGLGFVFFVGFLAPVSIQTCQALEYRSVAPPKAVMLDAPSVNANKLYIVGQGYPVEVIVNLGDWLKVRDQQGGINWIDLKSLTTKRTVLVTLNHAEIKQAADETSPLLASLDKDVVLDLLESSTKNGWLKVGHRDGINGYILNTSVWGAN
ncbi:MAG: hypothetical protein H7Z18_00370 [Methylophilaceae bacterium]|nr:hypothetical protein [Methylophilaceae bacterium]